MYKLFFKNSNNRDYLRHTYRPITRHITRHTSSNCYITIISQFVDNNLWLDITIYYKKKTYLNSTFLLLH